MPAVPERIGKYTISEVLGQGAMGVVYKGFDPHIQRPVAIKTIHKSLLGDTQVNAEQDSIAARFRNEAQAVGRVAHPGVVAIYEFGEDENSAYIAMEFVEGRNLDHVLAGTPLLAEAQVLRIMDQLLDALACAHDQGVWHRDIKPANLLLTASGQVKLTDFGIARIAGLGLTQVSSAIGTPGFMAPEQYIGEGIDQRADIFACGVLLYRLLTGKPAFSGTAEVVMYKIMNEHPPAPSSVVKRPAAYDAVCARAMAKRAEDRYPDARSFRNALLAVAQGTAPAPAAAAADNDATVIISAAHAPHARPPATAPAPPMPPTQHWQRAVDAAQAAPSRPSGATALAHFDAQTLSRIERALATHVGPMAKLMVRDAARSCEDLATLATTVSQHIADQARRAQFISSVTGGSQAHPTGSGSATGAGGTAPGSAASGSGKTLLASKQALDEAFVARATQTLTRRLGPIARVVVKRAAEQSAGSVAGFVQALLAAVPEGERAAVESELQS
ncbi:MAG: serine/threonine protein kinase [Paucibacter sp.]|nr:serine/threonine protein kinase [Roseateles sp.]